MGGNGSYSPSFSGGCHGMAIATVLGTMPIEIDLICNTADDCLAEQQMRAQYAREYRAAKNRTDASYWNVQQFTRSRIGEPK
jgi:hypothetical protein